MKTILIILLSLLTITRSFGQSVNTSPAGLKIGDKCPDFAINNIIRYKTTSAHLSDFKDRLVIIDFWATWCGSCLTALPELDSIQKKFKDKIQILAVTYEDKATVERFFNKTTNQKLKHLELPVVFGDKLLNSEFKHRLIPHEVWIDGNEIVRYFTDADQVKTENITAVINQLNSNIKIKKDKPFDADKPLLMGGIDSSLVDIQYSSSFTSYVKGLPGMITYRKVGNVQKVFATNHIMQNLYKAAFGEMSPYFMNNNRLRLELRDSTKLYWYWKGRDFSHINRDSLNRNYAFCYELEVSKDMPKDAMYRIMQQDLNRFYGIRFGVHATMEKRNVKCLVAKRIDNDEKFVASGDSAYIKVDAFGFHERNEPLDIFFQNLAYQYMQFLPMPIINDTGYTGNANIDINCDLSNVEAVRHELLKYGIDFVEENKDIDMIIIKDNQPYSSN